MRSFLRTWLVLAASVFFPCQHLQAQPAQETRNLKAFENVSVETSDLTNVYIHQDKTQRVVIKSGKRYLSKIKTTVSGNTLTIHFDADDLDGIPVEIYVYMPRVTKVSIVGGGNVEVLEGINPLNLHTSIAGGGRLLFKAQADVENFKSCITGGGSIDALKLQISTAHVVVSGGGKVLLQVKEQLEGNIAGGGDILYEGDPRVSYNVVGGGRVKALKN